MSKALCDTCLGQGHIFATVAIEYDKSSNIINVQCPTCSGTGTKDKKGPIICAGCRGHKKVWAFYDNVFVKCKRCNGKGVM